MSETESSSVIQDDSNENQRNMKIFVTQMLKNRMFVGYFKERRRVEKINSYRDVIVIHETETELKKDLDHVIKRLRDYYGTNFWVGITSKKHNKIAKDHCLWVESEDYPLGSYWYKIRSVRFRKNEIILRIDHIREIVNNEHDYFREFNDTIDFDLSSFLRTNFYINIRNNIFYFILWFYTLLTFQNIKKAIKYICVLLAAFTVLFIKGIEFFMNYLLKLLRELSFFVQSSTPIMIAAINLIGKVVGGFYLLILAMWRDRKPSGPRINLIQSHPPTRPQLMYHERYKNGYRSSVMIEEIE